MKHTLRSSKTNAQAQEILARIHPIFAEISGVEEMDLYSDLEDDLSVDMIGEFPRIINEINKTFSIYLDPKAVKKEVTSVEELIDLIIEETL